MISSLPTLSVLSHVSVLRTTLTTLELDLYVLNWRTCFSVPWHSAMSAVVQSPLSSSEASHYVHQYVQAKVRSFGGSPVSQRMWMTPMSARWVGSVGTPKEQ